MSDDLTVRVIVDFEWAPPGQAPEPYRATLSDHQGGASSVHITPEGGLLGMGSLVWNNEDKAIVATSGYNSSPGGSDEIARRTLLLKATNSLRRKMGDELHPATPRFPGSEL